MATIYSFVVVNARFEDRPSTDKLFNLSPQIGGNQRGRVRRI